MSTQLWHIERDPHTGMPVQVVPAPRLTVPEAQAQERRDVERYQREAKARAAEEADVLERRLDVVTVDAYTALGKAIGAITTEAGWVGLAKEIEGLAEAQGLSRRYETELWARLERVAKDRRWITS